MKEKRILLKLSGEALAGDKKTGFDESTVLEIAAQVKKIHDLGAQVGVVIGGGNSGEAVQVRIWIEPKQTRLEC